MELSPGLLLPPNVKNENIGKYFKCLKSSLIQFLLIKNTDSHLLAPTLCQRLSDSSPSLSNPSSKAPKRIVPHWFACQEAGTQRYEVVGRFNAIGLGGGLARTQVYVASKLMFFSTCPLCPAPWLEVGAWS